MIKLKKLFEDADAKKMDSDRFPQKLSQVDQDVAKANVVGGEKDGEVDDDTIQVKSASYPVNKLKPSQSSMNIEKAMGMALAMIQGDMSTGGDLGAFISNDMHIMDGHHRWVATTMVDPNAKVGGYIVNFPGSELIAVLNSLTSGAFGKTKGKPATGGFDQFKEAPIRAQLEKYLAAPTKFTKPEDIQAAIEKFTGETGEAAKEAAIEKFVKNLNAVSFDLPSGAPSREDMPIVDEPDVPKAVDALSKGKIDVNPPYANESLKEHFQKIARIKK
tara:strand:- start:945 stop:1766 length:822 start_codon:yes stop_codon:yes gene_type:complete